MIIECNYEKQEQYYTVPLKLMHSVSKGRVSERPSWWSKVKSSMKGFFALVSGRHSTSSASVKPHREAVYIVACEN